MPVGWRQSSVVSSTPVVELRQSWQLRVRQKCFFRLTVEQMDFQFQSRRYTWRSWVCLSLQCLWTRFRLGVVKTHSDVNSWSSHSPSSELVLLPCLRTHSSVRIFEDVKWKRLYKTHWVWRIQKNYSSMMQITFLWTSSSSNTKRRCVWCVCLSWRTCQFLTWTMKKEEKKDEDRLPPVPRHWRWETVFICCPQWQNSISSGTDCQTEVRTTGEVGTLDRMESHMCGSLFKWSLFPP